MRKQVGEDFVTRERTPARTKIFERGSFRLTNISRAESFTLELWTTLQATWHAWLRVVSFSARLTQTMSLRLFSCHCAFEHLAHIRISRLTESQLPILDSDDVATF